jgi:hypothetical protein
VGIDSHRAQAMGLIFAAIAQHKSADWLRRGVIDGR